MDRIPAVNEPVIEPTDTEIDSFLDEAIAGAAGPTPRDSSREGPFAGDNATVDRPARPSEVAETEADEDLEDEEPAYFDDETDDDEEAEDEEDDDEGEADEVEQLRQAYQQLQTQRQNEHAQLQQVVKATQVINGLKQVKQRFLDEGNEEGWKAWSDQLVSGFQTRLITTKDAQLTALARSIQHAAVAEAEEVAHYAIIEWADERFRGGPKPMERRALELCANRDQIEATLEDIKSARRAQTQPARDELRARRRATNAEPSIGVRRSAAIADRTGRNDYDNFNPDKFGDYLDDLLTGSG